MGNCLSVCLSVKINKKNVKGKKKKVVGKTVVHCCCNKSDVQEIYDEISITDIEI